MKFVWMKSIYKGFFHLLIPLLLPRLPPDSFRDIPRSITELSSGFPSHFQRQHSDRQARIYSLLIPQHSTTGKKKTKHVIVF